MTRHARQVTLLRPAAVAIHNDGDMARKARQIELFEEIGLFGRERTEGAGARNLQSRVCFGVRHDEDAFSFMPQS